MGRSKVSAWQKVFLRNGFFWPAYLIAWGFAFGTFPGPGWPLGFSDTINQVLTFTVLSAVWVVMCGGAVCLFRMLAGGMIAEARQKGTPIKWRAAPLWFRSYFLEIDEDNRLRP